LTILKKTISNADITVICLPVPMIIDFCAKFAKCWKNGAIVTDVGSVKEKIVKTVTPVLARNKVYSSEAIQWPVPSRAEPTLHRLDLYDGAMVFLTPGPKTPVTGL